MSFGTDKSFLVDSASGAFFVADINQLVSSLEADGFYPGDPDTLHGANVFLLERGKAPEPVAVRRNHWGTSSSGEWDFHAVTMLSVNGTPVANADYRIPTAKNLEAWRSRKTAG